MPVDRCDGGERSVGEGYAQAFTMLFADGMCARRGKQHGASP